MSEKWKVADMVLPFVKADAEGRGTIPMSMLVAAFQNMDTGLNKEKAKELMTQAVARSAAQVGESVSYISLLSWLFEPTLKERENDSTESMKRITVEAWGVLGTQKTSGGNLEAKAPEPGAHVAFIDPAGLLHIQDQGPSGAGGASGEIYRFLKITAFPPPVKDSITAPSLAKLHNYGETGEKTCIHVVGPDFRDAHPPVREEEATFQLAVAYLSVFKEFAASGPNKFEYLRLLPISGSIFAGHFHQKMPDMTVKALKWCFAMLDDDAKKVLATVKIEMCIFDEKDLNSYRKAFGPPGPPPPRDPAPTP